MSLRDRLAINGQIPQIERAHRHRFEPAPSGPAVMQHVPEWRRRQLERLAKNGRVAEKALER